MSTPTHEAMNDEHRDETTGERIPLGQRVFDNIWLLFALGLIVMFVVYTGWGLLEVYTMPKATLP